MFEEWSHGDGPSGLRRVGLGTCDYLWAGLWRVFVSSLVWVGLGIRGFGVSQDGEGTLLVGDDGALS